MKRLTDKQRQLVEDNMPLIYKVASKLHRQYRWIDFGEIVSTCTDALIATARTHDETKGAFSTLMYKSCRNHVLKIIRSMNAQKRKGAVYSINSDALKTPESIGRVISFEEVIGKEDEYTFLTFDELKWAFQYLDSKEKECIFRKYFLNENQTAIGKSLGYSQMQVSRIINRGLGKMKKAICEVGK